MKIFSLTLAGALLLASQGVAHAQRVTPMTAGRFGKICSSASGHALCDAYISGMADSVALATLSARNEGHNEAADFCIPVSEDAASMRSKVVAWLKGHTDTLSRPVGEGVFRALHDSYPCSAKK
ncbi:Rap1a/Tai family immunity protein [Acetobacter thailandicus]|uniref:Rap1a/Tai family immunity protein n=1 Tax=Acetobacter thailandicus TaxID=1502842 RepID=UPI001BA4CE89|nr:Rap1a/Tai family immunity protein [Acetobacter thailandicus]MBS0979900.1 hypothetical protein [Acetobacter thailandicus]